MAETDIAAKAAHESEEVLANLRTRLKKLFKEKAMFPATISKAAGLSESAARDILRERSENPGVVTLARLAIALGVEPAELIAGESHADAIAKRDAARAQVAQAQRHISALLAMPLVLGSTPTPDDVDAIEAARDWLAATAASAAKWREADA
ncbi:MAG: helix-turn-helix transcriptional regulator [Pseudomonadota bacterium]